MVTFHFEKFNTYNYDRVLSQIKLNDEESNPMPWELEVDVWGLIDSETAYMMSGDAIVGYCVLRIGEHHHYSKVVGISEVLWVHPLWRGKNSIMFLRYIEKELKKRGCEGFFQSSSSKKDISSLMTRMGYQPTEVMYFKEL